MILYLTYNDQPSGVYWSQVTDVVEHLNTLGGPEVKLVALVSGRDFLGTRKKIKAHSPSAWVLPMVPTMKRWKRNTATLAWVCRLLKPSGLICRGPFATWMALRMRDRGLVKRVCFDGRGAYAAEWEEYRIIEDDALIAQFRPVEREAVRSSDFRLAVSHALVAHWRERYAYTSDAHVVIPCTLGRGTERAVPALGGRNGPLTGGPTIRVVYSGSVAGWQSFDLLERFLSGVLDAQPDVHVLFLSARDEHTDALVRKYAGRVEVKWVGTDQVAATLRRCDHGLLVREDRITNRVASPTKFAEYLHAGLPVIVSEGIGDLAELVTRDRLGQVHRPNGPLPRLERTSASERERLTEYALAHFSKRTYDGEYRALLHRLDP